VDANQAIIDPVHAWTNAFNVSFGAGTTLPDTLYWDATRPSNGPGQPCTKTYPPSSCSGSCCPDLIDVSSAGISDGNYAYFKKDYRVVLQKPTRGFNVIVLSSNSHEVVESKTFDTYGASSASADFANFVKGVTNGYVVMVGILDAVAVPLNDQVVTVLESLGATQAKNIVFRGSYALIGVKGGKALQESVTNPGKGPALVSYRFTCMNRL